MRIVALTLVAALCMVGLLSGRAEAQVYPAKSIRIVVPWAPGGSTDVLARLIGTKMADNWGQPVVVENKPGASGNIGSDVVAKAVPDGYTLLLGSVSTHAMNPFLMPGMPFKAVDDFSTIALAAYVTNVLVTHPSVPAKSVQELIDLLKAEPGKIAYASAGNGSPNHIAAELFCRLAGVQMLHVPYKGGGPATAGIAGGQVGVLFTGLGNVWEHAKAGRLNLLAVTENRRSQLLPGVPMVGETVPGYEVAVWYGVWAPAGMRPELQSKLNAEVNRILTLPDVKQRLDAMGAEHVSLSAPESHALLQREYQRWGKIIRESGIKAD